MTYNDIKIRHFALRRVSQFSYLEANKIASIFEIL